ncbi:CDP-alcohol phosphatidyltransferase family protein [Streptomyces sp. NBC_01724]|uniref:CDP-alcohol phosphatidyltransferase family protein n=1 Tax=unclassified Streptomyces TaxID=2593676 RepID=UPI0028C3DD73|nr:MULTISPECIES: CDP-alcohol phosphatidyltransferase family protein [unclassified Streptomyces]WNO66813.1 CDP-alcohol phosphatidyltransferase family protein [Streptomyces sp. AM2-3-1]WSC71350.1 CDP-alcohol phosphatidyltransferase family protein [Streptomyces sp. NBC_01760]WTE61822.1 CDP-alcohol phosphatidyltransferase family protein [Streptomyces sp. NBC_01617]WTI89241.1 CDP-alcohol phosphatidyltransferase family protein [Streptomyces sp. NBC_00724]
MHRDIPPLVEVRRITQKKRDAWWTVLLVDPVATPLVRFVARRTRITPNQITWGALILGLVAAACFVKGDWYWLIAGALLYHLSFILDCMDGKVARLTGQGSVFGAWLDYIFDRIRVMACAVALMAGQYYRTGEMIYVWLAAVVVFLDGLRYINSLEIFKTRHTMRKQIKSRIRSARRDENQAELAFMEDLLRENPEADIDHDATSAAAQEETPSAPVTLAASRGQVIDLQQEFRHRFPGYLRFRSFMLRHRIRTHLISGIEFQMSVFIIGPLLDQIIGATIVSAVLLLVFELAIVYKLLLSTRDFTRTMSSFEQQQQDITTAA